MSILTGVIFLLVAKANIAFAQCAMCRATVENNVSSGETSVGAGLNYGIMYLFAAPYILAMVIGYFWYKNSKKRKLQTSKF
ncbi:hypothetical protein KIH41_07785 [Litoribacter ruber]|uniref:Uncharacterized protein n=1 Tax=Litoribacter ruber TaxID=702568 RepID=A0AAP2CE90_9BACT|nr:hypothetical protein [Litoribacter alkaliphilus]MBT0811177.1 hypothetical protein [Litoribacter ruber]